MHSVNKSCCLWSIPFSVNLCWKFFNPFQSMCDWLFCSVWRHLVGDSSDRHWRTRQVENGQTFSLYYFIYCIQTYAMAWWAISQKLLYGNGEKVADNYLLSMW